MQRFNITNHVKYPSIHINIYKPRCQSISNTTSCMHSCRKLHFPFRHISSLSSKHPYYITPTRIPQIHHQQISPSLMIFKQMASKFGIAIFLSLLVSSAFAASNEVQRQPLLTAAQQCRFDRLSSSQPSQRLECEAGVIELWDQLEEQFQCAGVAPMRKTLQPDGLLLPSYQPNPRLVYILQGEGLLGVTFPGCPETFHSESQQFQSIRQGRPQMSRPEEVQGQLLEQHQKIHRIRRGDIVALPAGAAHWVFNDGNEQLVAISLNDLNHQANQLDHTYREFFLAGGVPRSVQQGQRSQQKWWQKGQQKGSQQDVSETFQNIIRAFDAELLSEAYNVRPDIIERMQRVDERGLIVNAREMRGVLRPDEELQGQTIPRNGLEETFCSMKIRTNIDNIRDADTYSREAGKINVVNRYKLPILNSMDMSAEKGNLYQNAMSSPHWSVNGHAIVYVTRGEAQVEIVDNNGQAVMNERVNEGDMFVVPQYFTSTFKAERNGFEWVSFKTTGEPMKSPLVGYTSVMRAMPLQVITNAYQVSPQEAQDLKINRGGESLLLSPMRRS